MAVAGTRRPAVSLPAVIRWPVRMVRAILFDMGGTLDGDGRHWLDRFIALYAGAGLAFTREQIRAAFDDAEQRAAEDETIGTAPLDEMIERHVTWQIAFLERDVATRSAPADGLHHFHQTIVDGFVGPVREAAARNVPLLAGLRDRGLRLGVVSNGCGNVDVLCDDLGYSPYLSVVVDSRRVGLFKPDPAIFVHAAARLAVPAAQVLMVGDSFDRDVRPAKAAGLQAAWLEGATPRECPDPTLIDVRLARLADLPHALDARAPIVA